MKTELFDKTNTKVGTIELPEKIFNAKWNPDLVHQALSTFLANQRRPWAHAKDRSEVSGGGRKPWSQKHTGRSRHGSRRSPLWIGGGVTFGPLKEKSYAKKINIKMKRRALFSVLSKKMESGNLKIVESFELEAPKTKTAADLLKKFFEKPKSVLIITEPKNKNAHLAFRNIPKTATSTPNSLNIYECLTAQDVFFDKRAVEEFVKKYSTQE